MFKSVFIFTLTLMTQSFAGAQDCALFSEWKQVVTSAETSEDGQVSERAQALQREYEIRVEISRSLFHRFLRNQLHVGFVQSCLEGHPLRTNFMSSMHRQFFFESLNQMSRTKGPILSRLVKHVVNQQTSGSPMLFRLIQQSHRDEHEKKAGFHRATGSLYMDIGKIPSDEWFLVFVHELLHAFDADIQAASVTYSQTWRVDLAGSSNESSKLEFEAWLRAGLDRGFWAEYRAWYYTIVIYQEGLRDGLWGKIHWVENILESRPPGVALDRHIYDHFDRRFWDPRVGLFLRPEISEPLRELRERYRQPGAALPSRGALQRLLEP